MENVGYMLRPK